MGRVELPEAYSVRKQARNWGEGGGGRGEGYHPLVCPGVATIRAPLDHASGRSRMDPCPPLLLLEALPATCRARLAVRRAGSRRRRKRRSRRARTGSARRRRSATSGSCRWVGQLCWVVLGCAGPLVTTDLPAHHGQQGAAPPPPPQAGKAGGRASRSLGTEDARFVTSSSCVGSSST
jgi:hypothetical protein